ncbi:MAG: hypothetical protein HY748_00645 [Elusimicrobia bacterium]|nr:hypothetical protein [Elusimicrobiota bacterium]
MAVFEVAAGCEETLAAAKAGTKDLFEEGVRLYEEGRISDAEQRFSEVRAKDSDDAASLLYVARCRHLLKTGLPDDWQGVAVMEEKS